jgi:hypothetical protein
MKKLLIVRMVAVAIGAAVLFGLQHGLGFELYVAIPLAAVAYLVVKVALGLLWGADKTA